MNTIPIYVNGIEQGVCQLNERGRYIIETLNVDNTLTSEQIALLQNVWSSEYDPGDKVTVDKIEYTI